MSHGYNRLYCNQCGTLDVVTSEEAVNKWTAKHQFECIDLKEGMRALARFMVWVEMEAEASELWSDYDEDGNDVPRHFVCYKGGFDKYEYLFDAIDQGKLKLAWPE